MFTAERPPVFFYQFDYFFSNSSELLNSFFRLQIDRDAALAAVSVEMKKRDAVDDETFERAVKAVSSINPFSVKEVTSFGKLPVDKLLDLDLFEPKRRDDQIGAWIGTTEDEHDHTSRITAICLTENRPLDWNLLLRFFLELAQELGDDLYRVKGLVQFQHVDKPVIIQGVQQTFSPPTYADVWPRGKPETRIVVIGKGLDKTALTERFETCLFRRPDNLDRGQGAI